MTTPLQPLLSYHDLGIFFLVFKERTIAWMPNTPAYTVIIRSFPLFTPLFWINLAAYVTCLVLQAIWYHPQTLFFQAQFCIPGEHMKCFQLLFPNSDMGFCSTFFHRVCLAALHTSILINLVKYDSLHQQLIFWRDLLN